MGDGFGDWKNLIKLANHATSSNSSHVDRVHMGYALMNPNQSIKAVFVNQTKQMNVNYHNDVILAHFQQMNDRQFSSQMYCIKQCSFLFLE